MAVERPQNFVAFGVYFRGISIATSPTLKQPHAVPRIFVEVLKKRVSAHAN